MKFLKMVVSSSIIVGTNGLSIRYTAVMDRKPVSSDDEAEPFICLLQRRNWSILYLKNQLILQKIIYEHSDKVSCMYFPLGCGIVCYV